MRVVGRFLVLMFASYGPLAPIVLAYLLALPPLVAFSGWAWWIDLVLALFECGTVVGIAVALGPGLVAEVRALLEEEGRIQAPQDL